MNTSPEPQGYISTGSLPPAEQIRAMVTDAHARFAKTMSGVVSDVYPALARVDPELFGISIVGTGGRSFETGDFDAQFTIMSVVKPFVFALVCDAIGHETVRARVGVNATGLDFNSADAIGLRGDGRTNPMVNPGAIATTSLAPGDSASDRWEFIFAGLSGFAGRELTVDEEVYASASQSNHVNRDLVARLGSHQAIYSDPEEALDLYTRQCSLAVTTHDLATMSSVLANGGVNPITGAQVVGPSACRHTLTVMATAGFYQSSGDWLLDVGLPGKSGIGGGVITVAPGKGGLGVFSPRLDGSGTSVRGQLTAQFLSTGLGLDLFASEQTDHPVDGVSAGTQE